MVLADAPQELRDTYLAFRRDRRQDDVLGPRAKNFPSFDEPTVGLNPDLSRLVRAADGTTAHLVPGDGVLAIIEHSGGAVCGLKQALDGTTVGTSFRGTGRLRVPAEVRFILRRRQRRLAVPGADDEVLHLGPPP